MPQEPIIIPIIIAGITLGSLLVSQTHKLSKKKLLGVSLLSGALNAGNAFLVYQLMPPPTFTRVATQFRAAATAGSENTFFVSSFLAGFLIVLAIVGIALVYARFRGPKPLEEEEESRLEEPKLEET
jgi:hypothetical protein